MNLTTTASTPTASAALTAPAAPAAITRASLLWLLAVAAGVAETALALTGALRDSGFEPGLIIGLALRTVVYAAAVLLVIALRRGRPWARTSLTWFLTVVGLASLTVPAVAELLSGASFLAAVGDGDGGRAVAFAAVRLVHIVAVVAATVLMYRPEAGRWLRLGVQGPDARKMVHSA